MPSAVFQVLGFLLHIYLVKILQYDLLLRIPPKKRGMDPRKVWLTIIPFIGDLYRGYLWIKVFPRILAGHLENKSEVSSTSNSRITTPDKLSRKGLIVFICIVIGDILLIVNYNNDFYFDGWLDALVLVVFIGFINSIGYMIQLYRFKSILPDKEYPPGPFVIAAVLPSQEETSINHNVKTEQTQPIQIHETVNTEILNTKEKYKLLKELKELLDTGIISEEEFAREKENILKKEN